MWRVLEVAEDECVKPLSICGREVSRESTETQDACGAAGHLENQCSAPFDGEAFDISFRLLGVTIVVELTGARWSLSQGVLRKFWSSLSDFGLQKLFIAEKV